MYLVVFYMLNSLLKIIECKIKDWPDEITVCSDMEVSSDSFIIEPTQYKNNIINKTYNDILSEHNIKNNDIDFTESNLRSDIFSKINILDINNRNKRNNRKRKRIINHNNKRIINNNINDKYNKNKNKNNRNKRKRIINDIDNKNKYNINDIDNKNNIIKEGKIVIIKLSHNESIYDKCKKYNCYAVMVGDENINEIINLIKRFKLKRLGIGGYYGREEEMVLDRYGNIEKYNHNTKYILAFSPNKNIKSEPFKIFVIKPENKKYINHSNKRIINNNINHSNKRIINNNINHSNKRIINNNINHSNKRINNNMNNKDKQSTNIIPNINIISSKESKESIFPSICSNCGIISPLSFYITNMQIRGKKLCALSNCKDCIGISQGLTCPILKYLYQLLVDCLCSCRKDKDKIINCPQLKTIKDQIADSLRLGNIPNIPFIL